MRVPLWNINGIVRDEAQCKLRELVKEHKPDIIGIDEPRVSVSSISIRRFLLEGFNNTIIHNSTESTIGNLWVLWPRDITEPVVLNTSRQAITIGVDGAMISLVHARSVQATRRNLWRQLNMGDQQIPRMVRDSWNEPLVGSPAFIYPQKLKRLKVAMKLWNQYVFGNVNVRLKQAQLHLEGEIRVTDEDPTDLHKLNLMKDAQVEVNEIRMQYATMLKQKSINKWLVEGASNTNFFHNSIRMRRSNNTISELVDSNRVTVTDCDQIRDLMVGYFENKFNEDEAVPVDSLFNIDHEILSDEERIRMDQLPTFDEIHAAVFGLDADSAHGLDGFAGFSIDIAGRSFKRICLLLLLPKERGANTLRNFRPIGLSNLFFKIFTKILTTRLGSVLDKLVSEEQVAFMKGRNIHENISLASEMINEIQMKRKEGNVGLKLDITQAFDTVSWTFVMDVFRRYEFSDDWCNWILQILQSARISVLVNGSPEGNMKSLRNLMALLSSYQRASGHIVSREKSKLYYGGGSLNRRTTISDFLGMNVTYFPDRYLGVKVMPGAVKYHHISNVVEKIKEQLAVWKGRTLSFQDRVVLVKSVIASYSIHNMAVYKWPRKFIHQCDVAIRNFLWSGDSMVSKSFVVDYDKVCAPYSEGGLGITQMRVMNKAMLMKLSWNICNSKKVWARYLSAKFFTKNGNLVEYTKSSIFPGFRWVYSEVVFNSTVLIGDGRSTSLYFDSWWGDTSIADILGPGYLERQARVADMIVDGEWVFTDQALNTFLAAGIVVEDLPVPMGGEDYTVWTLEIRGSSQKEETLDHILWSCDFAAKSWMWIADVFGIFPHQNIITSYKEAKGKSRMFKDLWLLAILVVISEFWMTRSGFIYGNQKINWNFFRKKDFNQIHDYSRRFKGFMFNNQDDLRVLAYFRVQHRRVKIYDPKECYWVPPLVNELQLCCDGVSRGNPGRDGAGVVVCDSDANVLGAMSIGFGVRSN
ncbi:uncharacterized protein LOC113279481 [Papaver somniferum]|uniref:uncharacterized protein LOC113279481 n=1 Tax=Papaver somniferum TaxID=3469 RepID=UPI000E6F670F|nr:uncharacterized protein LOC113279481 [Papaver somniferum]